MCCICCPDRNCTKRIYYAECITKLLLRAWPPGVERNSPRGGSKGAWGRSPHSKVCLPLAPTKMKFITPIFNKSICCAMRQITGVAGCASICYHGPSIAPPPFWDSLNCPWTAPNGICFTVLLSTLWSEFRRTCRIKLFHAE